jgi:hypothetical protein
MRAPSSARRHAQASFRSGAAADHTQELIASLAQAPAAEEPRPPLSPPIRRAQAMASLFLHVMPASRLSPNFSQQALRCQKK